MNIKKITSEQIWPIRHKVMYPDKPIESIKLPNDEQGIHYGLFEQKQLISAVSVFIDGNRAQFRKFATVLSKQGKGYGTKLLSYVLYKLEKQAIARIWCNARVDKIGFYERFGMKTTEKKFTEGDIDFIIMEKLIR